MSLSWYIKRVKTFSAKEILYRFRQRFQTHVRDKKLYQKFCANSADGMALPSSALISDENACLMYPIFESKVNVYKPIDWHLDLSSNRRFPKTFAHKINIRSDEFGSAKHVWEVNRLLFLTHVAMLYRQTGNKDFLDLFMYHLTSWKNENRYMEGVNWYSNIEVNIRLINWAYCFDLLDGENLQKKNSAFNDFVQSVWMPLIFEHVEYSHRHPSLFSSANNHLVSEYAGLFIAACRWDIPKRESRLAYAQAGLEREILLQNSPEGVNREEAAEYIQFIDDFFLLAAIAGDRAGHPFSSSYKERLHQMARYLNAMLDVNFNYPMYGDGDDGFLLRPDAGGHFNNFKSLLTAFATYFEDASLKRLHACWDDKCQLIFGDAGKDLFEHLESLGDNGTKNSFLSQSGHYIFRKMYRDFPEKEIYLHLDAAPLGFLSIAAHGHGDALSFILHVDGHPVIADSGTFTYHTHKEWRKYFMGTLAHNTVRINGVDQATQAGPTMWLNHYKCFPSQVEEDSVQASHNGYEKMGVSHSRKVTFNREQDEFVIKDFLKGNAVMKVEIPFHFHPSESVKEISKGVFEVSGEGHRKVLITTDPSLDYRIAFGEENPMLGWYSDHFGEKQACSVLYACAQCKESSCFETKVKVLS